MMTNKELWAMDLRTACIHEAGHLVALHALGGHGHMRIWETGADDLKSSKAFGGQVQAFSYPEDEHQGRIVCMAGIAAEMLDRDPEAEPFEMIDAIESGATELSDTDARHGITTEAIEDAFSLLSGHWPDVIKHADWEVSVWTEEGESCSQQ